MATWPITGKYYMTLWLCPPNSLLEGGWWAFKENPYNAQIKPRQASWSATDMGLGA